MPVSARQAPVRLFQVVAVFFVLSAALSVNAQDKGAPPWGEFLRRFNKDPLLKTPFHMDPEAGVKGLASKIRARELDIPNRKRAIRYLKDLDCTQFPEAKAMLLELLDPKKEPWEEVRYEAAKGLRDMLARHSCNPDAADAKDGKGNKPRADKAQTGKCQGNCQSGSCNSCEDQSLWQQCREAASNAGKRARGERTKAMEPACHCKSCCDADTLNLLAKTAYEMKEDGCCYEPSLRVREMAVEAIKACGIPCHYKPYYGEFEEPGPPAWDEASGKMIRKNGEIVPPAREEGSEPAAEPEAGSESPLAVPPSASIPEATPIARLSNLCVVSLARGERVRPNPEITATHRGRIYLFASTEARDEFLANPERYAVAFGGCDPVQFVQTQQAVEGRYLAQHDGRFYMFASQANHELFKANPERYAVKSASSQVASR